MKENSYYKTPEGAVYKVTMYDDINKMVCIADPINISQNKWIHESEYSEWVECDIEGNPVVEKVEPEQEIFEPKLEIEEEIVQEKPIKKKAVKKAAPKKAVVKEPIKKAATKNKKNAAHKK